MRGIASIANAVAPVAAMAWMPSALVSGARKPISTDSARRWPTSCSVGTPTLAITSAPQGSPDVAPAPVNRSSGRPAAAPAPGSTITSWPWAASLRITSGTSATRRSSGRVSFGTPIFTGAGTVANACPATCRLRVLPGSSWLRLRSLRDPGRHDLPRSPSAPSARPRPGTHALPAPLGSGAHRRRRARAQRARVGVDQPHQDDRVEPHELPGRHLVHGHRVLLLLHGLRLDVVLGHRLVIHRHRLGDRQLVVRPVVDRPDPHRHVGRVMTPGRPADRKRS